MAVNMESWGFALGNPLTTGVKLTWEIGAFFWV